MAAWPGTKIGCAVSGSDLLMNTGEDSASYLQAEQDMTRDGFWLMNCLFLWEQVGGGTDIVSTVKLLINYKPDGGSYAGWQEFSPGIQSFRYYQFKFIMNTDAYEGLPVKITRFVDTVREHGGEPRILSVKTTTTLTPAALTPDQGDRHYIGGTAAGAWAGHSNEVAVCADPNGPVWVWEIPEEGQIFYDEETEDNITVVGSTATHAYCFLGRRPLGAVQEVDIDNAALQTVLEVLWPAGTFQEGDQFFVKLATYTGTNVGGFADSVAIQMKADPAGAYKTVWQAGPEGYSQKPLYVVHVTRGPFVNSEAVAKESADAPAAAQTTTGMDTAWIAACTGIKVLAQGDNGSLANAEIYADRNI